MNHIYVQILFYLLCLDRILCKRPLKRIFNTKRRKNFHPVEINFEA